MLQEFYRKFDLAMYELDFVRKGSNDVVDITKTSLEMQWVDEEWLSEDGEIDMDEVGMSTILGELHLEAVTVKQSDDDDDEVGTEEQPGGKGGEQSDSDVSRDYYIVRLINCCHFYCYYYHLYQAMDLLRLVLLLLLGVGRYNPVCDTKCERSVCGRSPRQCPVVHPLGVHRLFVPHQLHGWCIRRPLVVRPFADCWPQTSCPYHSVENVKLMV